MNNGILERIEAKLDQLLNFKEHVGEVDDAVTVGDTQPVVTSVKNDDCVEVDLAGVPWDERIHSGNPGEPHVKTLKGMWKKRKGVNDVTFKQVTDELLARVDDDSMCNDAGLTGSGVNEAMGLPQSGECGAMAGGQVTDVSGGEHSGTGVPTTPTPSRPGIPPKPNATLPPNAKLAPAVNNDRKECMSLISQLTDHGVVPAAVSAELHAKYGTDVFANIPDSELEALKVWLAGWVGYLNSIRTQVAEFNELNNTPGLPELGLMTEVVPNFIANYGGTNGQYGTIAKMKLSEFYTEFGAHFREWKTYVNSLSLQG